MTRVLQEFLHVDLRIAERRPRFGAGGRDGVAEVRLGVHDAHAAPAAAARGLDDHGIADLARDAHALVDVLAQRAAGTRHAGHPGGLHGLDGFDLVAHQADHRRGRTDEDEAGLLDRFGKIRVLRQKAIAGMDRRGVRHFRGSDDRGDVQITLRRRRGTDAYSLISHADVLEIAIDSGMHRNRFYSQRVASAQHAQGDLAAVGNQNLVEHGINRSRTTADRIRPAGRSRPQSPAPCRPRPLRSG